MEELLELLKEVNPNIDYENETALMSGKVIDSIDMTTILAEIEDHFDIEINMEYISPKYFDTVAAMWGMVQELKD